MRVRWLVLAMFLATMVRVGASAPVMAGDASGCEGLADYAKAMLDVGQKEVDRMAKDGLGPDREITSYSTDDWFDLVTDTGFEYTGNRACGDIPGAMSWDTQLDAGDATEANFCWVVRTEHVPTLRLRVRSSFSFDESAAGWFAIHPAP